MKIHAISNQNNIDKKRSKMSFKGVVNGNFYKDEIIKLAKENQFKKNWKQQMRHQKTAMGEAVSSWHHEMFNEDPHPLACRIVYGIFTFGLSELFANFLTMLNAKAENSKIEDDISQIAMCIDDLRHDSKE